MARSLPGRLVPVYQRAKDGVGSSASSAGPAQVGDFGLESRDLGLQLEDPAYPGEGEALVDETANVRHAIDVVATVPTLVALRTIRRDEVVSLQPAKERLLHVEHVGYLPDGEDRSSRVVKQ